MLVAHCRDGRYRGRFILSLRKRRRVQLSFRTTDSENRISRACSDRHDEIFDFDSLRRCLITCPRHDPSALRLRLIRVLPAACCVKSIDHTSVTLCTELMSRAQLPIVSGEFERYSSDGVIPAVLMSSLTRSTWGATIHVLMR